MGREYYDRKTLKNIDGRNVFQSPEDRKNERDVANIVEAAWNCRLNHYAELAAVDWWVERYNRIVGYAEVKCRDHATTKYKTVFLNQRKWLALQSIQLCGQPAVFIVRFTDGIRWIKLDAIDPRNVAIKGCKDRHWKDSDIEPIIEVPVSDMLRLKGPL